MTRIETLQMLSLLKASYPAFYSKFQKAELESIANLWTEMFEEENFEITKYALKELIATYSGYPPDIATVKNKIKELCATATGEETDEQLWLRLKEALKNGIYGSKEEFEKLPPVLQRYCGSPATIREMAVIDNDVLNTVNKGQFLKQIKIIREREEYAMRMPESMKMLVSQIKSVPELPRNDIKILDEVM